MCLIPKPPACTLVNGNIVFYETAPKRLGTAALEGIPVVQFTLMSLIIAQFI